MELDPSLFTNKSEAKFTTAHLPKKRFFTKYFFIALAATIGIGLIAIFPYEIGHFFGNWWQLFTDGIQLK